MLCSESLPSLCLTSLDLDVWINDPPSESEEEDDDAYKKEIFVKSESTSKHKREKYEPTEEELQKVLLHNYYILTGVSKKIVQRL